MFDGPLEVLVAALLALVVIIAVAIAIGGCS